MFSVATREEQQKQQTISARITYYYSKYLCPFCSLYFLCHFLICFPHPWPMFYCQWYALLDAMSGEQSINSTSYSCDALQDFLLLDFGGFFNTTCNTSGIGCRLNKRLIHSCKTDPSACCHVKISSEAQQPPQCAVGFWYQACMGLTVYLHVVPRQERVQLHLQSAHGLDMVVKYVNG